MKKKRARSVVITGVSSGIGYGCVAAFIQKGYRVFGSVRKNEDASRLQSIFGDRFFPLLFDITDEKAVEEAVQKVQAILGDEILGGLINNAGIAEGGPLLEMDIATVRKHFEVNVIGLVKVIQAFFPLLIPGEATSFAPGRIINISSVGGKIAAPFLAAYVGSKHAVEGISHSLRRELLFYGIDVIIVGPGAINTPIWDKGVDWNKYKDSPYRNVLERFVRSFVNNGKNGHSTERTGKTIVNIFEKKYARTRYAIVQKKLIRWTIPGLIPDKMLDFYLSKAIGLKK